MNFLASGIGEWFLSALAESQEASVAVAYFAPDERTLRALHAVPSLRIIVSAEFSITDPRKLAGFLGHAELAYIEPDNRKLHAKVAFGRRKDGTSWAIVGSANLTHSGLFANREACVTFESHDKADGAQIANIASWFVALDAEAWELDSALLAAAQRVWESRSRYVMGSRSLPQPLPAPSSYWILKTTEGSGGPSNWHNFLAEDVVAIGWSEIAVDPRDVNDAELVAAIQSAYPERAKDKSAQQGARMVRKFQRMARGDYVVIAQGYAKHRDETEQRHVHLYGYGRVAGEFDWDRKSSWFGFKRASLLQPINEDIPKQLFVTAFGGRESMRETIHEADEKSFRAFVAEVASLGHPIMI